jgi:hypothetical protein
MCAGTGLEGAALFAELEQPHSKSGQSTATAVPTRKNRGFIILNILGQ